MSFRENDSAEGVQPVVIIAAARSGTKFLRDVLGAGRSCHAVPYDINYVWRHGNESWPDDQLPPERCTPEIKAYIEAKLTVLSRLPPNSQSGFVIEKTVSNALRLSFVRKALPGAKFIHLIRDGRDVVESARRMWNQPPSAGYLLEKLKYFPLSDFSYAFSYLKNLVKGRLRGNKGPYIWGPKYGGIEDDLKSRPVLEVCARQWLESIHRARESFSRMPAGQWIQVRYEDLVSNEDEIRRICRFLELEDVDGPLAYYRKTLKTDTRGKWNSALSEQEKETLLAMILPTVRQLGFLEYEPAGGKR